MSAALMASIGARLGSTGNMVGKGAAWVGGYASSHPSVAMGAIGGVGGYIGSGGSGWGAVAGAGLGAFGGRKGWDAKSGSRLDRWSTSLAGKKPLVKKYLNEPLLPGSMGSILDKPTAYAGNWNKSKRGFQTSLRVAGTMGAGAAMGMGVGFAGNIIGASYGSERRSHHGAVFSGMGNGTVTGY